MKKVLCMLLAAVMVLSLTACSTGTPTNATTNTNATPSTSGTHKVTDSYGNVVEIPDNIERIVLTESYYCYISFVAVYGLQDKIVNDMPEAWDRSGAGGVYMTYPGAWGLPTVSTDGSSFDAEAILELEPDVVLCNNKELTNMLLDKGIPAVGIYLDDIDPISSFRDIFNILGEVFQMPDVTEQYLAYIDDTYAFIEERMADIPEEERETALYFDIASMSRKTSLCESWIPLAGGISATAGMEATMLQNSSPIELDMEALYELDPDFIIGTNLATTEEFLSNDLYADLTAVKNGNVYSCPSGCQLWGNWTAENVLCTLWAATKFYPEVFSDVDMVTKCQEFYSTFFKIDVPADIIENNILVRQPIPLPA